MSIKSLKANREDAISKARAAHYRLNFEVRELKKTLSDSQKEQLEQILHFHEERAIETARSMVIEVELNHRAKRIDKIKKFITRK